MMNRLSRSVLAAIALFALRANVASGSSIGTLCNFDVVNDTGHECHGFEIELEDTHPADVPYTFGGSYSRYGAPEILDTTVDPAHPRVVVRYRAFNGGHWETTPIAPAGITPTGHDCYQGGPIGNYLTSGCEHYGASLNVTPTATHYRWLVAANPSDPASTFSTVPETVSLPVPVWNVAPVVVAQPGGGVAVDVVVRAEVEPVEEENAAQWGEPQWMRVTKVETDQDLQPADLNLLLLGLPDGIVPPETEIETEWKLIQSRPGNSEGDQEDADVKEAPLPEGKRSIVRRYEFYSYTGPRDPENNEAFPCVDGDAPVPPDAPIDGCSDLGDFVGAQNVAIDIDLSVVDNLLPIGDAGAAYPDTPLVLGGVPPYTVDVDPATLPEGMHVDPVTGVLSGTPVHGGMSSLLVHVTDATGTEASATLDLLVNEDLCPADPDKVDPGACGCGVPDLDSDGDGAMDCVDLCPFDPAKLDPGVCGCDVPEGACGDLCPDDPAKTDPGLCGCGVEDNDSDGDGVVDCLDACPNDPGKSASAGICGCGEADTDGDGDGTADCFDACPVDAAKTAPGTCGCGVADTDGDGDGMADCLDACPVDATKTAPGTCGCGVADTDSDGDGMADCLDACPVDAAKTAPGTCGCGVADTDVNDNGIVDCQETVRADLALSIRQVPAKVKAGKPIHVVLTATNFGPDDATGVVLRASVAGLAGGTLRVPESCTRSGSEVACPLGKLLHRRHPGTKSRTLAIIPASGSTLAVMGAVSSPVYDPVPGNETEDWTIQVP